MSIIKILTDNKMEAEDKLTQVAEIVANAREAYGNSDAEIPAVKVSTSYGELPFSQIEDDSKVEVLLNQAMNMKGKAIAFVENKPGAVLNKKVQELIATNPFFANTTAGTEFEYL